MSERERCWTTTRIVTFQEQALDGAILRMRLQSSGTRVIRAVCDRPVHLSQVRHRGRLLFGDAIIGRYEWDREA